MSSAKYVLRYRQGSQGPAHLGLAVDGQVYDLTALGRPEYASLEAWLSHADRDWPAALQALAQVPASAGAACSAAALAAGESGLQLLAPLDTQEVWACGVTYTMSRAARMRESQEPTIYGRVYDAPRPEVFMKATPHRVVGPGEAVGIRSDSAWDVPEPELTLLVTPGMHIAGYTAGNDMSSRDIEGENPLYLPQAKIYDRCCALGPWVRLADGGCDPKSLAVRCAIQRGGQEVFSGETNTANIHRSLEELVEALARCNSFPAGVLVMTGTGIVPPDHFSLQDGDRVEIAIEGIGTLANPVVRLGA